MRRGRESTIFARGRGLLAVPLLIAGLALAATASAGAATICVKVASASCESSAETIPKAFEAAENSAADDRVVIGPGRFEGPFVYSGSGGRLEVVGQGPGTVIGAPSSTTPQTVLTVRGQGSLVSNLTVRIPSNTNAAGDTGIDGAAVNNVRVASDAGEPAEAERVGVVLPEPGGYMRNSVVELVDGSEADVGVQVEGGSRTVATTVSDSRVIAPFGITAEAQSAALVRDRVVSSAAGVFACNSPATVEDTLVRVVGSAIGLLARGDNQCSPEQSSIVARQVTLVGAGTGEGSVGVEAGAAVAGQSPQVEMVLSIVRNVQTAFLADAISAGSSATIAAGASDFEGSRVSVEPTGGAASFSEPEADIDADPRFTSDLLGEFGLGPGSPAIDSAYSPPLAAGESTTDLAGNPRVLDGNGDGVAARDMGAYEAPAVPDTTPPDTRIVKPKMKKKGKKKLIAGRHGYPLDIAFTSSEPNSHFECRLDAGKFAPCTSPFKKHLAAGLHRFEVRAIDAAGNVDASPARENFRISKAPVRHHHKSRH